MDIMGTGSREIEISPDRDLVVEATTSFLEEMYILHDDLTIICGGAEGFDYILSQAALTVGINYVCVIPTKDYGSYYWERKSVVGINRINDFDDMLAGAISVVYLESMFGPPIITKKGPTYNGIHANLMRNQVMVDMCDFGVVLNPNSAGTRDAVNRLLSANKPFKLIHI